MMTHIEGILLNVEVHVQVKSVMYFTHNFIFCCGCKARPKNLQSQRLPLWTLQAISTTRKMTPPTGAEYLRYLAEEIPPKHDICVWVRPSTHQTRRYQDIINSNTSVSQSLLSNDKATTQNARMCAIKVINNLRKICDHPLRMHGRDGCDVETILKETAVGEILNGSDKLKVALHLLEGFRKDGQRTLLFSQSTEMLDIIQYVLNKKGACRVARLDGSVSETNQRLTVELFQNGEFDVFLLSTGAGGVGLTLTRATRVIVFDPSWNPSVDAQAVDRVYRIKQTHEVRVYRLFLAGSVEEKIYEKQTDKDGIQRSIFTEGSQGMKRLWDKRELSKVFAQIPNGSCDLLEKFGREGIAQVPDIHRHDLMRKHSSVIGISNHAGVYKGKRKGAFMDANTHSKARETFNRPR